MRQGSSDMDQSRNIAASLDDASFCDRALLDSNHIGVAQVGENVRIIIQPSAAIFAAGLAIELVMTGLGLYSGRPILFDQAVGARIGRKILFVTLFPALIFAFPGWLWMTREVLTLTPGAMQLRRELWRIGHTREYDIKKVRNFGVQEFAIRGFRHTILFDHDMDLGVSHEFGKDLNCYEAKGIINMIEEWKKSSAQDVI
jgi:hypothetical protein